MHTLKLKGGFTLIELILTMVVIGILGAFGFSFFSFLTSTYVIMKDERGIQQEGAYIVERIARELRDASAVAPGTDSATITLTHNTPASLSTNASYLRSSNILTRNGITIGEKITSFSITAVVVGASNCYSVSFAITSAGVTRSFQTKVCPRNLAGDTTGYKGKYFDTY
ncbi:MAG: hypothetical protein C0392_09530 [Syntrophus sp. (in: bacteria)]|nr:hypothetical protein [Syntrophus sp. (in: bacteria)]